MQLVEKYQPRAIADFAGLERPRAILSHFAAAPYSSAWMLTGPSGLGKTTMALALAEQIGGELHHIPSQGCNLAMVEEVAAKCHYYPWKGNWHIVLVDEADQMSRPAQNAFLSVLDTTAPPPNTIFIFTSNGSTVLEPRFLSRCRVLKFETTGMLDSITVLLRSIWIGETGTLPPPDFRAIAAAANLNIRQAIMDLELEIMAPVAPVRSVTAIDAKTRAIQLRRDGASLSHIAKELGAPQSSVWRWTREAIA